MSALIAAFTPATIFDKRPPPYINISDACSVDMKIIVSVRSIGNADGTVGQTASIDLSLSELHDLLFTVGWKLNWLPLGIKEYQNMKSAESVVEELNHKATAIADELLVAKEKLEQTRSDFENRILR